MFTQAELYEEESDEDGMYDCSLLDKEIPPHLVERQKRIKYGAGYRDY